MSSSEFCNILNYLADSLLIRISEQYSSANPAHKFLGQCLTYNIIEESEILIGSFEPKETKHIYNVSNTILHKIIRKLS